MDWTHTGRRGLALIAQRTSTHTHTLQHHEDLRPPLHPHLLAASAAASPAPAPVAVQVTYDQTYDNGANSLNIVACSNGVNGLITRGFTTFESLPSFPFIGGAFVAGFNSTECGSCWEVRTETNSVNIAVIDHAAGFNIALEALDFLTHGNAVALGKVNATAVQVPPANCGM